jgi:hypothetical protein
MADIFKICGTSVGCRWWALGKKWAWGSKRFGYEGNWNLRNLEFENDIDIHAFTF